MKIAIAQINPTLGALNKNAEKILTFGERAEAKKADLVVFPELALTGYPPEDLLSLPHFISQVETTLEMIQKKMGNIPLLFGLPRRHFQMGSKPLFNSAVLVERGKLPLYFDKMLLPNYDVFSELRYFEPGKNIRTFECRGKKIGVTICEDIWGDFVDKTDYREDPLEELKKEEGLDVVINLSASPYSYGKISLRHTIVKEAVKKLQVPFFLCNQVGGNDGLIFDGGSFILNKKGNFQAIAKPFEEDLIFGALEEKKEVVFPKMEKGDELLLALTLGLRDYFQKTGAKKACLGISGGIDSAVVASIAKEALGKENVVGISLPSRFTSKSSREDAKELAKNLDIEFQELSIEPGFESLLSTLQDSFKGKEFDIAEENMQSRLRAILIMAIANKHGYYALATGNKSEAAVGYTTLYGDAVGAISVIGDLSKGEVYEVARAINRKSSSIPISILKKAPTAELRHGQKDSDTLPDYPILDAMVKAYVEEEKSLEEAAEIAGCSITLAQDIVRKIHLSEYKRRQIPFSLRVSSKAFLFGRRFPIAQGWV